MRKPRSALLFFVLLALGLFWTVPAEDLPETAYDESEVLPFEGAPLVLDVMPQATASTNEAESGALRGQSAMSCRATHTRIAGTEAHRSAEARVALALLCTLLC